MTRQIKEVGNPKIIQLPKETPDSSPYFWKSLGFDQTRTRKTEGHEHGDYFAFENQN